jgi:hypothetical protein
MDFSRFALQFCSTLGVLACITALRYDAARKDSIAREEAARKDSIAREEAIRKDSIAREELARKKMISREYQNIRHLESLARRVCKEATRSACNQAKDYIRFAEIYGRSRAIDRGYLQSSIWSWRKRTLSRNDLEKVEAYRKEYRTFFCHVYELNAKESTPSFPGKGEFESYLTFHWTINMANTICAEQKELYGRYKHLDHQWIYKHLLEVLKKDDISAHTRVEMMHAEVRQQLLPIRSRIFGGTEDQTGL